MTSKKRQATGADERVEREREERDMTSQTQMRGAARFMLQTRSALLAGLRLAPVAALLIGVATMAPAASATSCYQPTNVAVNGGRVSQRDDPRPERRRWGGGQHAPTAATATPRPAAPVERSATAAMPRPATVGWQSPRPTAA